MNDEDIKKALECCSTKLLSKCLECKITKNGCAEFLASQALALINRQQAEIERQQLEIEKLKELLKEWKKAAYKYADSIENIKSEAIKEFAERLKKEVANTWFGVCCTGEAEEYKEGCLHGLVAKQKHCLCSINNLLAEMVGGENA